MKKCLEYCEHHGNKKAKSEILKPLPKKNWEGCIPDEWERNWAQNMSMDMRAQVLTAANIADIPALFELMCAAIAIEFKYKEWEEIRGIYGLDQVAYQPEDAAMLFEKYNWLQDEAQKKIQALIDKKHANGEHLTD